MLEIEHEENVRHMSLCEPCRKAAWAKRGGHPVLNGTQRDSRNPEAVAWGPNTTNPNIERFLETGDPSGV